MLELLFLVRSRVHSRNKPLNCSMMHWVRFVNWFVAAWVIRVLVILILVYMILIFYVFPYALVRFPQSMYPIHALPWELVQSFNSLKQCHQNVRLQKTRETLIPALFLSRSWTSGLFPPSSVVYYWCILDYSGVSVFSIFSCLSQKNVSHIFWSPKSSHIDQSNIEFIPHGLWSPEVTSLTTQCQTRPCLFLTDLGLEIILSGTTLQ